MKWLFSPFAQHPLLYLNISIIYEVIFMFQKVSSIKDVNPCPAKTENKWPRSRSNLLYVVIAVWSSPSWSWVPTMSTVRRYTSTACPSWSKWMVNIPSQKIYVHSLPILIKMNGQYPCICYTPNCNNYSLVKSLHPKQ